MHDTPAQLALTIAQDNRAESASYYNSLENQGCKHLEKLKIEIQNKNTTRYTTYKKINPQLQPNPANKITTISEEKRIAAARFRLSSHQLMIEKGRWARLPPNQRICDCTNRNEIQDEHHVIFNCKKTDLIRNKYNFQGTTIEQFFQNDTKTVFDILFDILDIFK